MVPTSLRISEIVKQIFCQVTLTWLDIKQFFKANYYILHFTYFPYFIKFSYSIKLFQDMYSKKQS